MNAIQLQKPDGTPANAWVCGECKTLFNEKTGEVANRCCVCTECGKSSKREPGRGRSAICETCWGPYHERLEQTRLNRAVEVTDYTGPVCTAGDRYYATLDDMIDTMDGDEDLPEFVYACHVRNYTLDIETVVQNIVENANVEDDDRSLSSFRGYKELVAAVDAFNAANLSTVYWDQDTKRKVRVPRSPAPATEGGAGTQGGGTC